MIFWFGLGVSYVRGGVWLIFVSPAPEDLPNSQEEFSEYLITPMGLCFVLALWGLGVDCLNCSENAVTMDKSDASGQIKRSFLPSWARLHWHGCGFWPPAGRSPWCPGLIIFTWLKIRFLLQDVRRADMPSVAGEDLGSWSGEVPGSGWSPRWYCCLLQAPIPGTLLRVISLPTSFPYALNFSFLP